MIVCSALTCYVYLALLFMLCLSWCVYLDVYGCCILLLRCIPCDFDVCMSAAHTCCTLLLLVVSLLYTCLLSYTIYTHLLLCCVKLYMLLLTVSLLFCTFCGIYTLIFMPLVYTGFPLLICIFDVHVCFTCTQDIHIWYARLICILSVHVCFCMYTGDAYLIWIFYTYLYLHIFIWFFIKCYPLFISSYHIISSYHM